MFPHKLICFLCISLVMAYPFVERTLSSVNDRRELVERAAVKPGPRVPSKKPPPPAGAKKALGSTSKPNLRTNALAKNSTRDTHMGKGSTTTGKHTSARSAGKPSARKIVSAAKHSQPKKGSPAVAKKKSVNKQASKKSSGRPTVKKSSSKKPAGAVKKSPSKTSKKSSRGGAIKNSSAKKPSRGFRKPPSKAPKKSSGGRTNKNSSAKKHSPAANKQPLKTPQKSPGGPAIKNPTKNPSPAAKKPTSKTSPARDPAAHYAEMQRNFDKGRKLCRVVSDCFCPSGPGHSTSCINRECQCDNKLVAAFGSEFLKATKAVGDAPITKAVNQVFKTMSDIKQVGGKIVGAVFGKVAGKVFDAAANVIPDVGSSHIDDATHGALKNL